MKSYLFQALCVGVFALSAQSCKKDPPNIESVVSLTYNNLAADPIIGVNTMGIPYGSGKYTFFNLETGAIVPNSDSATSNWDIAFRGTTIATNSGNFGPGAGGAFVYVGTFESLKSVSVDSSFRVENVPTAYAIRTGSNNGWYSYNAPANLITPIPGRILVVRTAHGEYAKIEILSYYKDAKTPDASTTDAEKLSTQRYYTFRYSYQKNGSFFFE